MRKSITGVGVSVIVKKDGKILLGQRKGIDGAGQWGVPGGHLEFGETLQECAHRELREETNLKVETLLLFNVIDQAHRSDGRHYLQISFIGEGVSGNLENKEPDRCAGLEWFELNDLPELFFAHKKQIELYRDGKGGLFEHSF